MPPELRKQPACRTGESAVADCRRPGFVGWTWAISTYPRTCSGQRLGCVGLWGARTRRENPRTRSVGAVTPTVGLHGRPWTGSGGSPCSACHAGQATGVEAAELMSHGPAVRPERQSSTDQPCCIRRLRVRTNLLALVGGRPHAQVQAAGSGENPPSSPVGKITICSLRELSEVLMARVGGGYREFMERNTMPSSWSLAK